MSSLIVFAFMIPGIILFFLGRYIGHTGYVEILKQYNEKKVYDKEALTHYVKQLMMITGILTFVSSLGSGIVSIITKNEWVGIYFLAFYVIITFHYVIRLRFSCKKFEIKET